jgi:hypothetical protein
MLMLSKYFAGALLISAVAATAQAQISQRRASIVNGNPGEGRCVVEVVVDGAAEVDIRGDNATLQNLKGQAPQWRRFECTAPMPANPVNFRFSGIDGRGSQQLVQSPRNGVAAIRIDDPDNGSEGYTFEVTWGGNGGYEGGGQPPRPIGPPPVGPPPPPPGLDYGYGRERPGRPVDDAITLCQSYVRDEAARRYGAGDVVFRQTAVDDRPGRNDWLRGYFEARRGRSVQAYSFSCLVSFNSGQVRSADIQRIPNGQYWYGNNPRGRAIPACEASVEERLRRDGYSRVDFGSASFDDQPGRNDWITGTATATDRNRPAWFNFSCSVDARDGAVRSVNVDRR